MNYRCNRASKCPYYPHITQNIPLEPPKWAASQLNLPEMLLSTSPKTHRKARNCFLIPYQAVWCPPRAVVVTVHGSVSSIWCMWPPWKSCYCRPHESFTSTSGQQDMAKPSETFHHCTTLYHAEAGMMRYLDYWTSTRPIYPHISEFDPQITKIRFLRSAMWPDMNPIIEPTDRRMLWTGHEPNHWTNRQKNALELQCRHIESIWMHRNKLLGIWLRTVEDIRTWREGSRKFQNVCLCFSIRCQWNGFPTINMHAVSIILPSDISKCKDEWVSASLGRIVRAIPPHLTA